MCVITAIPLPTRMYSQIYKGITDHLGPIHILHCGAVALNRSAGRLSTWHSQIFRQPQSSAGHAQYVLLEAVLRYSEVFRASGVEKKDYD